MINSLYMSKFDFDIYNDYMSKFDFDIYNDLVKLVQNILPRIQVHNMASTSPV